MKLLHLYHDLMNLYGDYANMSALCRILTSNGIEATLDKKSLGDEIEFNEYDFVYVGSGTEQNQKLALEHLHEHSDGFKAYLQKGGFALFTGNAFEMLGKTISGFLGEYEGLGVFDFATIEQNKTRTTADAVFTADFLDAPLVGFINKCSQSKGVTNPLFKVEMGLANSKEDNAEGVLSNNFFGSHLTGPVLVKNPHFLKYLVEKLTGKELSDDAFSFEKAGYKTTLQKLKERMGQ